MRAWFPMVMCLCGAMAATSCTQDSSSTSSSSSSGVIDPKCQDDGQDAATSCVKPCDPGNERGVGEFCTYQGGQCDDNLTEYGLGSAIICAQDFDRESGQFFCTKPCNDDTQCGTGAVCLGDPSVDGGEKGCVPPECQ